MKNLPIRQFLVPMIFLGSPLAWLSAAEQIIEENFTESTATEKEQLLRLEIRRAGLAVRIARTEADLAKRDVELAKSEYEERWDLYRRSPNGDPHEFRRLLLLWERVTLQSVLANYHVRDSILRRRQLIARAQLETGKSLDELLGTESGAAEAGKRNVPCP